MSLLKLKNEVSQTTCNLHPQDVLDVKSTLNNLGLYKTPSYGMTPYGDMTMLEGIKTFQKNNGLKVDGVMKPGGETETAMNKFARKASYVSHAAMQGVSSGWADEIEGAAGGFGYALGSLVPAWNKTGESPWQAAKRGYVKYRDQHRELLKKGHEEVPSLMNTAEFVGSIASPSFNKINKAAPLRMRIQQGVKNSAYGGAAYGLGSAEGGLGRQLLRTGVGTAGGYLGGNLSKVINRNVTGGMTNIGLKTLANKSVDQAASNLIEHQINKDRQIF